MTVTPGAYQNFYRHIGYAPVEVAQRVENLECGNTHDDEGTHLLGNSTQQGFTEGTGEDDFVETDGEDGESDLSEIPLGEMSLSQLYEYAEQLGLDYEGNPSKKVMLSMIRNHLR